MNLHRLVHARRAAPFRGVPGPEPTFPLGNVLDFTSGRPWETCAEYGRRYGKVSVFWLFGEPVVLLHDATLIGRVLESGREDYYKDNPCGALRPILTDSSPNINNGEEWARKRAANPMTQEYARAWLESVAVPMRRVFEARFARHARATEAGPVPFQEHVQRWVFDAFSVATVGRELGDDAYADFLIMATAGSRRMLSGLPFFEEAGPRVRAARARWHAAFAECLAEARRSPDPARCDMAAVVARAGTSIPDAALHAELGNVFFGGDFSVPSSLVTAAWCLTRHPEEAERLRAELAGLPKEPGLRDIEACAHLDHVLRESMRFRAAVPLFDRRVLPDRSTTLGGLELPPNTHVFITNWRLHADPGHWSEPEAFRPDRWANGVAEANPLGSGHFFPLGRGPRMCMGLELAMATMKVFLATLYGSCRVEAGKDQAYDDGQRYFFGVRMPWGIRTALRPL